LDVKASREFQQLGSSRNRQPPLIAATARKELLPLPATHLNQKDLPKSVNVSAILGCDYIEAF
jgi:hypothetical protein